MTPQAFAEFLEKFKSFMEEESLGRLQFLKYVLVKSMEMDEAQYLIFIQTMFKIEIRKSSTKSNKEEFDRITKGLRE